MCGLGFRVSGMGSGHRVEGVGVVGCGAQLSRVPGSRLQVPGLKRWIPGLALGTGILHRI